MKVARALLGAALLLAGCASAPDRFYKPYTNADQFNRDYAECRLYAMNVPDRGTDVAAAYRDASPLGAIIRGVRNAERPHEAARLCMQAKCYSLQAQQ